MSAGGVPNRTIPGDLWGICFGLPALRRSRFPPLPR